MKYIYLLLFPIYYSIILLILFNRNFDNCISLVIPATYYSWNKCSMRVEKMICDSLDVPKEIIIVISGSRHNGKDTLLTYCKREINLYYRKDFMNSASNKNFGSKLSKCNYISYFDSDDIMSPTRITILYYIINHFINYDIILHMYTRNYSKLKSMYVNKRKLNNYFYLNSSYISFLYKNNIKKNSIRLWGCCHFLPKPLHISNGWITIKKSMFISEKFNEDSSIQRAEDSEYNGRVISKGYRALILKIVMGYYSRQNDCTKF